MQAIIGNWQLWAGLSALFAALTAILAKLGVAHVPSDFATFYRTVVVVAALGVLLLATGQFDWPQAMPAKSHLFLVASGLATGASWLCYFRALKLGNAAQVAPVDKLSVVLVAIIGAVFLGEKLTGTNWLGVAMIGAGAVLVALR